MRREIVFGIGLVVTLIVIISGIWYSYQKGYIRPSADMIADIPGVNYSGSQQIQSGTLDGVEYTNGIVQLQSAQ